MKKTNLNNQNLNNLKQFPLLNNLSIEEFDKIKKNMISREFTKGEIIFRSHDPADKMFIILSGEIKVTKIMSDGKEQILYIYGSSDFIGGHNILSGDKYEYNASALSKVKVITISSHDVLKVLKYNVGFLLAVIEQSFERIRKAEELIDRLSVINTDEKVAKLLKTLIGLYGKETDDGILISYKITQEELGSLAGISRETMSRKLNQFEEEGILKIVSRGKLLILDEAQLDNILI